MVAAGNLRAEDVPGLSRHRATLGQRASGRVGIVEELRIYRHPRFGRKIRFRMKPGFANFQRVKQGELLARDNRGANNGSRVGDGLHPPLERLSVMTASFLEEK